MQQSATCTLVVSLQDMDLVRITRFVCVHVDGVDSDLAHVVHVDIGRKMLHCELVAACLQPFFRQVRSIVLCRLGLCRLGHESIRVWVVLNVVHNFEGGG